MRQTDPKTPASVQDVGHVRYRAMDRVENGYSQHLVHCEERKSIDGTWPAPTCVFP
jgi:hypothetical protein